MSRERIVCFSDMSRDLKNGTCREGLTAKS